MVKKTHEKEPVRRLSETYYYGFIHTPFGRIGIPYEHDKKDALKELKDKYVDGIVTIEFNRVDMDLVNDLRAIVGDNLRIMPKYYQEIILKPGTNYGEYPEYTYEEIFESERILNLYANTVSDQVDKDGEIKRLSPLEKFIAAWIIVTKFATPKLEDSTGINLDDYHLSRSIYEIIDRIHDRRICCVGYVNILMNLLWRMGIKETLGVELIYPDEKDVNRKMIGHLRMLTYLNDPKYKVRGVFMSDPTWDAKGMDSNLITHMLLSHDEVSKIDQSNKFDIDFNNYPFDYNGDVSWAIVDEEEFNFKDFFKNEFYYNPIPKETIIYAFLAVDHFVDKNKKMVKDNSEYTIEEFNEMAHRLGLDEYMKKNQNSKVSSKK